MYHLWKVVYRKYPLPVFPNGGIFQVYSYLYPWKRNHHYFYSLNGVKKDFGKANFEDMEVLGEGLRR